MSGLMNMIFHDPRGDQKEANARADRQEKRLAEQDAKQQAREKSLREDQDARIRAIRAMQGGRPTLLETSETGVGTKTTLGA